MPFVQRYVAGNDLHGARGGGRFHRACRQRRPGRESALAARHPGPGHRPRRPSVARALRVHPTAPSGRRRAAASSRARTRSTPCIANWPRRSACSTPRSDRCCGSAPTWSQMGRWDGQRDHVHLVRCAHHEAEPQMGWERAAGRERPRAAVVDTPRAARRPRRCRQRVRFAPFELPALVTSILTDGPPQVPFEIFNQLPPA